MRTTFILIAGFALGSAAVAASSDPFAEERYRLKYGYHRTAEEARRAAAKPAPELIGQSCCRREAAESGSTHSGLEARFRMKFGRNSPAEEARQKAAARRTAAHVRKCAALDRCPLVPAPAERGAAPAALAARSDVDIRLSEKYGRLPTIGAGAARMVDPSVAVHSPAGHAPCTEPCCEVDRESGAE